VLEDGRTGLLAPERSVEGLVAKLEWLVENPGSWHRLAVAARAHIERAFSAEVQGSLLAQHYESLLTPSKSSAARVVADPRALDPAV
jgi:glycosyltransferase involved in cell wall biosynthesis